MGNLGLAAGRVLADRFEIGQAVGKGGMGAVYRAWDRVAGCEVALKLLQPHGTPQESERFARAIQAQAAYLQAEFITGYEHTLEAWRRSRPGSYWWTKATSIHFYICFMISRFEHIERMIAAVLEAEPDPDARAAYLEAGLALATLFGNTGRRKAAVALASRMGAVASLLAPEDHGTLLLMDSWRIYNLEPDPFRALQSSSQATVLLKRAGDRHHLALGLFHQGMELTSLGLLQRGEQALREGYALEQLLGSTSQITVLHLHLGLNLAAQVCTGVATDRAREEARSIGERYRGQPELGPAVSGAAHLILGRLAMASGDLAAAGPALQTALQSFASMLPYHLSVVPLYVEWLLKQGRDAEARSAAEQAVRRIDEQGGLGYCEVAVRLALALSCFAAGDPDAGRSALRQVRLRAERIESPELHDSYLQLPESRQIAALARAHGLLEPSDP